jgi:hypothetical protein
MRRLTAHQELIRGFRGKSMGPACIGMKRAMRMCETFVSMGLILLEV